MCRRYGKDIVHAIICLGLLASTVTRLISQHLKGLYHTTNSIILIWSIIDVSLSGLALLIVLAVCLKTRAHYRFGYDTWDAGSELEDSSAFGRPAGSSPN